MNKLSLITVTVIGVVINMWAQTAEPGVTFTRVTSGPTVTDSGYTWGCAWVDYNLDGYPDLFVLGGGTGSSSEVNRLYLNNHDGTFTRMTTNEVGGLVGDRGGWFGCTWADFNNDGWPDVYLTCNPTNALFLNLAGQGFWRAWEVGGMVTELAHGQSASWADYNNDGWVDLWVNDAYTPLLIFA